MPLMLRMNLLAKVHGFQVAVCVGVIGGFHMPLAAQVVAQSVAPDPLALESAPVEKVGSTGGLKMFVEGALGSTNRRNGQGVLSGQRLTFDLSFSATIRPGLRAVFSDRVDASHPRFAGSESPVNSLREAYLSWQVGEEGTSLDVGRINYRIGPGYGYNPTDFFRDGSLRVLTSADPLALRLNRIGSFMVRGQHLWESGSVTFTFSPKLATRPNSDGWSLDFGSTNNRNRGLLAIGTKLSDGVNSQVLLYKDEGMPPTWGVNMTALLTDATVAHLEWTRGKEPDLRSRIFALPLTDQAGNRFVGGVTYTTSGKTSITAEYQYNGFGIHGSDWVALGATPGAQLAYVTGAIKLQEIAPKQAILIYVSRKDFWVRNLEFNGYVRYNPGDHSKLAWLELRRHWTDFDITFQLQQHFGRRNSEFGILPDRRIMQVVGTYYF